MMFPLLILAMTGGVMSEEPIEMRGAKLGQVALTVTDIDQTRSFYKSRLGLPLRYDMPNMLIFGLGDASLLLSLPEDEVAHSTAGAVVYLEVADVVLAHAALRKRGVGFVDEPHVVHRTEERELWMTFFRDPDGHLIALMGWKGAE